MTLRIGVCCVLVLLMFGCAFTRTPSQTPRTATEQLLLSQAIERSLNELSIPLGEGSSLTIETVGFAVPPTSIASSDLAYARDAMPAGSDTWDFAFSRRSVPCKVKRFSGCRRSKASSFPSRFPS